MEGYFYDRILLYYNGKMCTEFLWLETRTIASRCGHFNVVSGYVKCGVSPQSNFGIVSQIKPPLNSSPLHNPLIILSSDFIQYKQIQAPRINNIFKKKLVFICLWSMRIFHYRETRSVQYRCAGRTARELLWTTPNFHNTILYCKPILDASFLIKVSD